MVRRVGSSPATRAPPSATRKKYRHKRRQDEIFTMAGSSDRVAVHRRNPFSGIGLLAEPHDLVRLGTVIAPVCGDRTSRSVRADCPPIYS